MGYHGKGGRTSQEAVELHQELEVDVVALGGTAVSALDVVAVQIDTCEVKPSVSQLVRACSETGDAVLRFRGQDGALVAGRVHSYTLPTRIQRLMVKSFTYPWRRLSLRNLAMLGVELDATDNPSFTFRKIQGLWVGGALAHSRSKQFWGGQVRQLGHYCVSRDWGRSVSICPI